ncbi:L-ascorbate metabolism protein UlaG, beta-lactamase superfamily [Cyclobacterium lianum]|uniref:L-ascorbate metabolism protein UlaG, beta-lactamase superfamily n=2 Tax=Cyclobacterium lianum TaxID=388280 RepID=A0A1M7MN30_9BACT|nr:L-ascorbate metabolism protein UlaG, beta-lactamase superfamily [Cyclobacterium lianum]
MRIKVWVPVFLLLGCASAEEDLKVSYMHNPALKTIHPAESWKGNPVDQDGRFLNLYHKFDSSFGDLWKWKTSANPQKEEKESETRKLEVNEQANIPEDDEDYLIWLGHASFLIRINGKVMITDPILFDNFFLKRESPLPFPAEDLPAIDYLLISHNHRDHCDKKSIQFLSEKNPGMEILTGLKLGKVIRDWTRGQEIQEAGWYQQYQTADLTITYLPSRHWSRRWLWDLNENLWGGFHIAHNGKTVYFMGDSGFGKHFEDIRQIMGNPEYCLMGVGAYKPEWFMSQAHISPQDAIEAFNILGGRYFIPMHYGTFDLSDEPRMEPWDILNSNQKEINGNLIAPVLGNNLFQ